MVTPISINIDVIYILFVAFKIDTSHATNLIVSPTFFTFKLYYHCKFFFVLNLRFSTQAENILTEGRFSKVEYDIFKSVFDTFSFASKM